MILKDLKELIQLKWHYGQKVLCSMDKESTARVFFGKTLASVGRFGEDGAMQRTGRHVRPGKAAA